MDRLLDEARCGPTVVLKRVDRPLPDWRTIEGMARDAGRLTDALKGERPKGLRIVLPDENGIMTAARTKAAHT